MCVKKNKKAFVAFITAAAWPLIEAKPIAHYQGVDKVECRSD